FKLAGVGTAAGLLLAVPMFAALSSAVAGVGQLSPWSIAIVCAGLIAMVAAACYLPARRAALTDPNLALRIE
ncbi:MAG TPA: hypothetical protein VES20_04020, partial [Bryobacteraceae bacterium]|nr:hypothetical protein [Bryobacteraceae bacterium]